MVTAALTLTAAAVPAVASTSTTTTPATGTATSSLTVADVSLAGQSVQVGSIAAVASDASSRIAKLVVTPLTLNGTPHGSQTVDPSTAPATVPSSGTVTVSLPSGLGSVTGPTFTVDAQAGPTAVLTSAVLKALGAIDLKPAGAVDLPINLQAASLTNLAKVTSTQAEATKSLTIGTLSLPDINTLLAGLGVNVDNLLAALTQDKLDALNGLVSTDTLTSLNAAVDSAQAALTNAPQSLDAAQAALAPAQDALTQATTDATAADGAWSTAITAIGNTALSAFGVTTALTPQQFEALSPTVQSAIDALTSADLATLASTAVTDDAAKVAAQTVVDNVNALIDALQNLVAAVLAALSGNTSPLLSLGNVKVVTSAIASDNSPAPVATASIGSVDVLGAAKTVSQLTSALSSVTTTLTGILTSVTGVTFSPPSVALGTGSTSRTTSGATHTATAAITGVTITMPKITLPASLSTLQSAVDVVGGQLKLGVLSDAAQHTPGSSTTTTSPGTTTSTPGTSHTPSLAKTGLARTIPMIAALLVVAALAVLHRRRRLGEI